LPAEAAGENSSAISNNTVETARLAGLLPVFLLVLLLGFLFLVILEILILVLILFFLGRRLNFERTRACYGKFCPTLLAGELVAFVELVLFDIDCRIAHRAIHHLASLQ
jgi:hypothetical protein